LTVFKTLDLEEKRALIPELFSESKIVNGDTINNVSPDFIHWICSGKRKQWKQEDVEKAWEMWNFLYRRVSGGSLYDNWLGKYACVWNSDYIDFDENEIETNKFYDRRDYENSDENSDEIITVEITRDSFFTIVLKEVNPDSLDIGHDIDDLGGGERWDRFLKHVDDNRDFRETLSKDPANYKFDLVPDPRSK